MPAPELKLDSLFTEKFFQAPITGLEASVVLGFPLPSSVLSELPSFLKTQGRKANYFLGETSANTLTFYRGFNRLIDGLHNWCVTGLPKTHQYDIGMLMSVMRNHLEYDGDEDLFNDPNWDIRNIEFYTNGPVYLAKILQCLASDKYPLIFKQQIISQFLDTMLVDQVCPKGCNLNLHDTLLQFTSDLATQLMLFRKRISENVTMEFILKNTDGYFSSKDHVYYRHWGTAGSGYYTQLAIATEEKNDLYCQEIMRILAAGEEITISKQKNNRAYAVAKFIRDEFPEKIAKAMTGNALIDYLFELPLPIENVAGKETKEQVTLQNTLDQLFSSAQEKPEFSNVRKAFQMERFEEILKYFGLDAAFSQTHIFNQNFDAMTITDPAQETYSLKNPLIVRNNIIISLLHRLKYKDFIKFDPMVKRIIVGTHVACHYMMDKGLQYCFVTNDEEQTRVSYAEYLFTRLAEEVPLEQEKPFQGEIRFFQEKHEVIEFLELVLSYLFYTDKFEPKQRAIWKQMHDYLSTHKGYRAHLCSKERKVTLLHVAARWGLVGYFQRNHKVFEFSAHGFGAMHAALSNQHWDVVNFLLDAYQEEKVTYLPATSILTSALLHKRVDSLKKCLDMKEALAEEESPSKKLVKSLLGDEQPENKEVMHSLVELAYAKVDAPGAVLSALNMLTHKQVASLMLAKMKEGRAFLAYCFTQSDVAVMQYFSDKKAEVNQVIEHPELLVDSLVKHKDPVPLLAAFISFFEGAKVFSILKKIPSKLLVEKIVMPALELLEKASYLRKEFIKEMLISKMIKSNDHMLLGKIIKCGYIRSGLDFDSQALLLDIKKNKAWECFLVLYQNVPDFMAVEDELAFEMALNERFDISGAIYASNPHAVDSICQHYSCDAKKFLEKHDDDVNTAALMLFDLAKYRCSKDYDKWADLVVELLIKLKKYINELIFIKFLNTNVDEIEDVYLLDYFFKDELLYLIFPYLSDSMIKSPVLLKYLMNKLKSEDKEDIALSAFLENTDLLKHFLDNHFLDTDYYIESLLAVLGEKDEADPFPKGALALIQFHNQFSYRAAVPFFRMAKVLQKAIYANDKKVIEAIFQPDVKNVFFKDKVNSFSEIYIINEQNKTKLLFQCLHVLLGNKLGTKKCEFLEKEFDTRHYDAVMSRMLLMRPYHRLQLMQPENESLLVLMLKKMTSHCIKLLFSDSVVVEEFQKLVVESANKEFLLTVFVDHMFASDLFAMDKPSSLRAFFSINCLESMYLLCALALREAPLVAFKKNPKLSEDLLMRALQASLESAEDLEFYSHMVRNLIDELDKTEETSDALLILWARIEFSLSNLSLKVNRRYDLPSAVDRIKRLPNLPAGLKYDTCRFLWLNFPGEPCQLHAALKLLFEFDFNTDKSAAALATNMLSTLLNKKVEIHELQGAYEAILRLWDASHFLFEFPKKLKTVCDLPLFDLSISAISYKALLSATENELEQKVIFYSMITDTRMVNYLYEFKFQLHMSTYEKLDRLIGFSILHHLGSPIAFENVKDLYIVQLQNHIALSTVEKPLNIKDELHNLRTLLSRDNLAQPQDVMIRVRDQASQARLELKQEEPRAVTIVPRITLFNHIPLPSLPEPLLPRRHRRNI